MGNPNKEMINKLKEDNKNLKKEKEELQKISGDLSNIIAFCSGRNARPLNDAERGFYVALKEKLTTEYDNIKKHILRLRYFQKRDFRIFKTIVSESLEIPEITFHYNQDYIKFEYNKHKKTIHKAKNIEALLERGKEITLQGLNVGHLNASLLLATVFEIKKIINHDEMLIINELIEDNKRKIDELKKSK